MTFELNDNKYMDVSIGKLDKSYVDVLRNKELSIKMMSNLFDNGWRVTCHKYLKRKDVLQFKYCVTYDASDYNIGTVAQIKKEIIDHFNNGRYLYNIERMFDSDMMIYLSFKNLRVVRERIKE